MSPPVDERSYLSIGEVLTLLRDEFPDITISKIRFLESQGLLDPERTPSGYRKFYDADVERLRWILQQQKDNFLPLKVIKDKLEQDPTAEETAVAAVIAGVTHGYTDTDGDGAGGPAAPNGGEAAAVAAVATTTKPRPRRSRAATRQLDLGVSGAHLTTDELATATGLPVDDVRELERFRLIAGRDAAGTAYYDEEALLVARLAAGFRRFGVEARHLRVLRTAAEREAGLYEQLILPIIKQRNPAARQQAADMLDELIGLGEGLRAALVRQTLKEHTSGQ